MNKIQKKLHFDGSVEECVASSSFERFNSKKHFKNVKRHYKV